MSEENKEVTWDDWVRSEVNALLDLYLPEAATGNVGIKYDYQTINTDEAGNPMDVDRNVITGVNIQLAFDFAEPLEKIKDEE